MLPAIELAVTGGGRALMGPQAPINAHSLPFPAVAGPWLKSEGCAAVQ